MVKKNLVILAVFLSVFLIGNVFSQTVNSNIIYTVDELVKSDLKEGTEILGDCKLKDYTKITEVFGCGILSGTHLGTDIWPGRNNILYVACEEKESKKIITSVKEIRKSLGVEGIKAFLMPLEEMT